MKETKERQRQKEIIFSTIATKFEKIRSIVPEKGSHPFLTVKVQTLGNFFFKGGVSQEKCMECN